MTRYTVRTDIIPRGLKERGFIAWIHDADHPDDIKLGASCAWCAASGDAERIAAALNRDAAVARALHRMLGEEAQPPSALTPPRAA
jgi:hypothetical protein